MNNLQKIKGVNNNTAKLIRVNEKDEIPILGNTDSIKITLNMNEWSDIILFANLYNLISFFRQLTE